MNYWESAMALVTNPFILCVGGLQLVGGIYSFYIGDWRLGVVNSSVSIANCVLATMKG